MRAKLVQPPTIEPVTVSEFRDQSRIDAIPAEEAFLWRIISTARQIAENQTWITLAESEFEIYADRFPDHFEIPYRPVTDIVSITYLDEQGDAATVSPSDYRADLVSDPAKVAPVTAWPQATEAPNSVVLRFRAGYTPSKVPPQIKHAILVLCDHLYQHRGQVTSDRTSEIPFAARELLNNVNMRGF